MYHIYKLPKPFRVQIEGLFKRYGLFWSQTSNPTLKLNTRLIGKLRNRVILSPNISVRQDEPSSAQVLQKPK